MGDFIRRSKRIMVFAVVLVSLVAYFGIIRPMRLALEESETEAFIQLTGSKFHAIENTVARGVEGAVGQSSRTMLHDALYDYRTGAISVEELKEFTQHKYVDGTSVLENLMLAQRYAKGQVVAEYGENAAADVFEDAGEDVCCDVRKTFAYADGELLLEVVSPIKSGDMILGYDRLIYQMSDELTKTTDAPYRAKVLLPSDYEAFMQNAEWCYGDGDVMAYRQDEKMVGIAMLQEETAFMVEIERSALYATLTYLTWRALVVWVITFVVLVVAVYFYILRYARKKLGHLEESRDEYKGMVYRDKMTGAYSRMFLEAWKTTLRPVQGSSVLVMIDIDNFKRVNDQHGHLVGDEVIIAVSSAIQSAIRHADHLIRFGGDEFLLVLENINEEDAAIIVARMEKKIQEIDQFSFGVSVSWGIASLAPGEGLNTRLREADARMYTNKNTKKA